jgi:hypothetical protein
LQVKGVKSDQFQSIVIICAQAVGGCRLQLLSLHRLSVAVPRQVLVKINGCEFC